MQSGNQDIQKKLLRTWRRQQRFFHTRGVCHALLWIVGLILFDLALDWSFDLPGWARVGLLAANVSVLVWIGYRQWWRLLHRYDPLRASLAVERLHPELNSLLVSYVQLQPGDQDAPLASPQLIAALKKQAVETVRPLDFRGVVDFRKLRNLALAATVVLVAFELSGLYLGEFYRVLAVRLVNPTSDLGYPTRTHIKTVSGDLTVRQGDSAELAIEVDKDSEVPGEAVLQISYDDGPWEKVQVEGDAEARFAHSLPRCTKSFVYRFRAGDARSKQYAVSVIPCPQILESVVRLRFPEYTTLAPEEITALNFEVIEGTEMEWEVHCDQALTAAAITCDPGQSLKMTIDKDDPRVARLSMKAGQSLAYQFNWTDRDHGYHYTDNVRYSLQVTPDEPPQVLVLPPMPEQKATLDKTLNIRFRVQDTYGLDKASIVYSVNGAAEEEHALGSLSGRSADRDIEWKPREWIPELADNDILTYAIKVTDNHSGERGPNAGLSKNLSLRFLAREDYLQAVMDIRSDLFDRVKGVQADESESSGTLKELRTQVKP